MAKLTEPMVIKVCYSGGEPRWSMSIEPDTELSIYDIEMMLNWCEEFFPRDATPAAWNSLIGLIVGYKNRWSTGVHDEQGEVVLQATRAFDVPD